MTDPVILISAAAVFIAWLVLAVTLMREVRSLSRLEQFLDGNEATAERAVSEAETIHTREV